MQPYRHRVARVDTVKNKRGVSGARPKDGGHRGTVTGLHRQHLIVEALSIHGNGLINARHVMNKDPCNKKIKVSCR